MRNSVVLRKIILVFSGIVVSLVLLESALRIGGVIFLSLQEHRNRVNLSKKDSYRVLCLGESMTLNQYPPFLEEYLNRNSSGLRFSVIDKGVVLATTSSILLSLQENLDRYKPDIVVTMMGCNDSYIKYFEEIPGANESIFQHCRVYRLAKIIYMHVLKKLRREGIYGLNKATSGTKIELDPKNVGTYVRLGWFYKEQGNIPEAEESFKKALELDPKNSMTYFEIGRFYERQKKFSEAEAFLRKGLELNPRNGAIYFMLKQLYSEQDRLPEVEVLFKKVLELNPENDEVCFHLGQFYREQGNFPEAEALFRKAIELNPKNDAPCAALEVLYLEKGDLGLAKEYGKYVTDLRSEYRAPFTTRNYHKLKTILDKRGITYVCVQYPMRNLNLLKKIFQGDDKGIIFVDNEKIFKDAVAKDGCQNYFIDLFAGDFGHCTPKGNRLLAENIAHAILKEEFHEK